MSAVALGPAVALMLALVPDDARAAIIADPVSAIPKLFDPVRLREVDLGEAMVSDRCSCDGFYDSEITPGTPWILFRHDVVHERLLFTLLHELGHHVVRHVEPSLLDVVDELAGPNGDVDQTEEQLCHAFSSEILIPTALVDSLISDGLPRPRDVVRLKESSSASWEAVAVRVARLIPGRGAVVLVRASGSVGFSAPSPSLRAPWPRGSTVRPGGPLAAALRGAATDQPEVFRWKLEGPVTFSCDTEPVDSNLAVAVLSEERPSGEALLARIRGVGLTRPSADVGIAAELRRRLDDAVEPLLEQLPEAVTVRVTKARLQQVLTCERYLVARLRDDVGASADVLRGRMLDRLFVQVVLGYPVGADPVADAIAAAAADGDASVADAWAALSRDEQAEVDEAVRHATTDLVGRWPQLPSNALVRLQESVRVELAAGRVVLAGRVDLMVGMPTLAQVGTTLIDVKSGRWRFHDAVEAGWYALLETLRHGVAPFQTGMYYLRDGALDLHAITPEVLERAAARVVDGTDRLVRLATGKEPAVTPNPLCPWCPVLAQCEPGRRHVEDGGTGLASVADEDDDDDL